MRFLSLPMCVLAACGGGDDGSNSDGGDGDGIQFIDGGTDGIPNVGDAPPGGSPGSLRFFNSHTTNADRVEIRIDPNVPADIGAGSFTIDFWFRVAGAGTQPPATCQTGRDGWKSGMIILDRDRMADGPNGEFGLSVFANGVAFGLSQGTSGIGICGSTALTTGWHHVAVTRDAGTRAVTLYLDGVMNGTATGPAGDVSFQNGSTGAAKDPFLVIGANKFEQANLVDLNGFVDELRISTVVRYTADFMPETQAYASADADTAALYHFNDAGGTVLGDERGMSPGDIKFGTDTMGAAVPIWVISEPFLN
jgi:hypothetical protein